MSNSDEDKDTETGQRGITRGDLLKTAAAGAGVLMSAGATAAGAEALAKRAPTGRQVAGMNVLVFLTDQQRAVQHFPPGWTQRNMPGLHRLQQHGITFENAFTNACMCSPARSTLDDRVFPGSARSQVHARDQHAGPDYPDQVELATTFKNPASVVASAGYTPVYKGKFHCVKPADEDGRRSCPRTSISMGSPAGIRKMRAPTSPSRRRAAATSTTTGAS